MVFLHEIQNHHQTLQWLVIHYKWIEAVKKSKGVKNTCVGSVACLGGGKGEGDNGGVGTEGASRRCWMVGAWFLLLSFKLYTYVMHTLVKYDVFHNEKN